MEKSLSDVLWVTVSAALVFMMQGGFLCLEAGLTRSKNSINVAIKNLTDFGISFLLYWAFGFAVMFGATANGWFGTTHFFVSVYKEQMWLSTFFLFQAMFCGTAVTIVSGGAAERMRFAGYMITAAVTAGLIYPFFGHLAWGGAYTGVPGWLAARGFVDFAGASVVHSVGGWVTLAAVMIIGPRAGRFSGSGDSRRIPGSNLPLAMLGVLLLWFGWMGFNGGSTFQLNDQVPGIIARTVLAGGAGMIATLLVGWRLYRYPDARLVMNGSLAGLVAVTANVHTINAFDAVVIGGVGGIVMLIADRILERFRIDDVVGAFPVHTGAGVWGTLAAGIFGDLRILGTGLSRPEQIMAQAFGIAVCAFSFVAAYTILSFINRIFPLRVTPEDEYRGLNVAEHKATTEIYDLFVALEKQRETKDLSLRAPEEPFTEVGQIAKRYNAVMDSLQEAEKERTILEAQIRQAQKLKMAGVMASGIAHNFNNILGGIRGFVDMALADVPPDSRVNADLKKAIRGIEDAKELSDKMLLFSREHKRKPDKIELRAVVNEALELFGASLTVPLKISRDIGNPCGPVRATSNEIRQVVMNLCTNAHHAMADTGGLLKVGLNEVNVDSDMASKHPNLREGKYARLTVSDTGHGMDQETMDRIFEPFFTTKAIGKGTGLGLSVIHGIVMSRRGEITVESRPGKGTTFHVYLPLAGDNPEEKNG